MTFNDERTDAPGARPLEGVLVADFSRVLAGPLVTMTLADLGARVIKVERPGAGDETRAWGPPFAPDGMSIYFQSVNRNKESIALDLQDPADAETARRLAVRADVVIENLLTGGMDRLGLGYEAVAAENTAVVYASITGFGSSGGAGIPGYDFVVQALGGLMSITGEAGGEPMKAGVALVDVLTAKDATIGILAALRRAERTGRGAHVEVNLLSSLQAGLVNQAQSYLGAGAVPGRLGNVHPSISPYQTLRCSDAPIAVAVGNDRQFAALARELGLLGLADDPRFASNAARVAHRAELVAELESVLATAPAADWQARLTPANVPVGRINTIAEGIRLADDLGLDPVVDLDPRSPGDAPVRTVRHPALYTPGFPPRTSPPPRLGEQSAQIRAWLDGAGAAPASAATACASAEHHSATAGEPR